MKQLESSNLVLVVDDDRSLASLFESWIRSGGYECEVFHDGKSCLTGLASSLADCAFLDLNMPGLSGLETLHRIKARHPLLPVIVLTSDDSIETVVSTMQAGAYDYLTKPVGRPKLLTTLQRALEQHRLSVRVAQLEREAEGRGFHHIVGASSAMCQLFRQMDRLSTSDITLLVHGESGTGKELVAQTIHETSGRGDGPFVAVNCAAIPDSLEESEFFGHEKGAFTGATERRIGRLEQAHQGTLFLDEVGELSLALQAKLLRVLQERRFHRVGGSSEMGSDFRLIAATHRKLEEEVEAGRFREDLFYRIAVFELEVPPLRSRNGDVRRLANRFLVDVSTTSGREEALNLTPEAVGVLMSYPWPGNVRELQNAIQRAGVVARDGCIRPMDLPERIWSHEQVVGAPAASEALAGSGISAAPAAPAAPATPATPEIVEDSEPSWSSVPTSRPIQTLAEIEKDAILEAVDRTDGNLSEVVRQLGIGRTTLYRKLHKYGLR